jgi:hypothetical protein
MVAVCPNKAMAGIQIAFLFCDAATKVNDDSGVQFDKQYLVHKIYRGRGGVDGPKEGMSLAGAGEVIPVLLAEEDALKYR